jgi:hypothetical protein
MPLSEPVSRAPMHHRKVDCQGFLRDDGLIEIEGRLVDTKPYDFDNKDRGGVIVAGEPLHGMAIRIAIDDSMTIREAEAAMDHTPYNHCKAITGLFENLVGVTIGAGWTRMVRETVGGVQGCTHMSELLRTMATTAFQTMVSVRHAQQPEHEDQSYADYVPFLINTCHTHAEHSPVVKENWPEFYKGN